MKDRRLWLFAVSGLITGLVLMVSGTLATAELASLARGYGLLIVLTAVYLAAGLAIRARMSRRSPAPARPHRTGASSHSSSRPA
jgi:uncharacterized membrane-anchored protein